MVFFFVALWIAIFVRFYATEGRTTYRELRLRWRGVEATGTLADVYRTWGRYGPVTVGLVRYTVDGRDYHVSGHIQPGSQAGEAHMICYDPARPERAVVPEGMLFLLFKTAAIVAVTVILGLCAVSTALPE